MTNQMTMSNENYVGFKARLLASILDTLILMMITAPLLYLFYGGAYFVSEDSLHGLADFIISYIFPLIATILFWVYKSATPGKIVLSMKIVDKKTGNKPSVAQSIIRYIGYYVSLIPLGLGFFWIIWDDKNQGWHDKIAGTLVVEATE
ncbi:MAG: RDD family protein [Cognaticolwellia sp.]